MDRDRQLIEVSIEEGLDREARGVGHTEDGLELRLPGVIPGERVAARVLHAGKKKNLFGLPEQILSPSPDRVPVDCAHFLDCGGCDYLHMALPLQHLAKRQSIAEALGLPLARVSEVIASPRKRGYRALAKLVLGPERILGSYRPRSHEVVDMAGCVVHAPEAEAVVDAIRQALRDCPAPDPLDLRYVLVRATLAEARTVVTLVAREEGSEVVRWIAERLYARSDVARVVLNVNPSEGDALVAPGEDRVLLDRVPGESVEEQIGPIRQTIEAGAFAQVNPLAAAALYAEVARRADPAGKTVLDLYSGSGGIGLTLAKAGAKMVRGIEAHPEGVKAANASAAMMGLEAVLSFEAGSVEERLPRAPKAEVLVLNPPRKGVSREVIESIAGRSPLRLIYVSCNPESLARDVALLEQLGELEIEAVVPVDLFPETRHVETVLSGWLRRLF